MPKVFRIIQIAQQLVRVFPWRILRAAILLEKFLDNSGAVAKVIDDPVTGIIQGPEVFLFQVRGFEMGEKDPRLFRVAVVPKGALQLQRFNNILQFRVFEKLLLDNVFP